MSKTILIIGGTGLIGQLLHRMLLERNPSFNILIGTRKKVSKENYVQIDRKDLFC